MIENFINMFKSKHSYQNANSITGSNILSWNREKMYNIDHHYSWEFPVDRRNSKPPSEMLKEYYIDFL